MPELDCFLRYSYALQCRILLRRENPTHRYWAPVTASACGFRMVLFTVSHGNNFVGGTCTLHSTDCHYNTYLYNARVIREVELETEGDQSVRLYRLTSVNNGSWVWTYKYLRLFDWKWCFPDGRLSDFTCTSTRGDALGNAASCLNWLLSRCPSCCLFCAIAGLLARQGIASHNNHGSACYHCGMRASPFLCQYWLTCRWANPFLCRNVIVCRVG